MEKYIIVTMIRSGRIKADFAESLRASINCRPAAQIKRVEGNYTDGEQESDEDRFCVGEHRMIDILNRRRNPADFRD
jgi:hypothetical protein